MMNLFPIMEMDAARSRPPLKKANRIDKRAFGVLVAVNNEV